MTKPLEEIDYIEPACPFCTDQYKDNKIVSIPLDRVINKLDEYLQRNDYTSAKKHLLYWKDEAESGNDKRGLLSITNELIGLCRKTNCKDEALNYAQNALALVNQLEMQDTITGGTTFVNVATAYKAFGLAKESLPIFIQAKQIYEKLLNNNDPKLGGLYNNMALAYVDVEDFDAAFSYYQKAIDIMTQNNSKLEVAITLLNQATAYEMRDGILQSGDKILECLDKAKELLCDSTTEQNGYTAFVYEKCVPAFRYYGDIDFAEELTQKAKEIYERN